MWKERERKQNLTILPETEKLEFGEAEAAIVAEEDA